MNVRPSSVRITRPIWRRRSGQPPATLAAALFAAEHVVEVKVHPDGRGVLARTRDAAAFHRHLSQVVLEGEVDVEAVAPADDDVGAVYQYLIGSDAESM